MMDKELIDQLWNRATRETLNSGTLNERYRFAELVAEQAIKYGPSYQMGYADGAFEERQACAAMVKPLDESLADEILARGNP
jgi:hypothetical protein